MTAAPAAGSAEARHPALQRVDDVGAQFARGDDAVDRADALRPLDRVHGVELGRDFAELARPSAARAARTRGSASVRCFTSRANTVAAAGVPPITEATAPSTAAISIDSFSFFENTTKAPPW